MYSCTAPFFNTTNFGFLYLGFRDGWAYTQCLMGSDLVLLPEPSINCDLSLFGGVEPFRVEHFF